MKIDTLQTLEGACTLSSPFLPHSILTYPSYIPAQLHSFLSFQLILFLTLPASCAGCYIANAHDDYLLSFPQLLAQFIFFFFFFFESANIIKRHPHKTQGMEEIRYKWCRI